MKIKTTLFIFLSLGSALSWAQTNPLGFEMNLAGNFGELRPNHFHAGIDIKTKQSIGHDVYSFADGYIDRVAINAKGYGLVVYVTHPKIERMTVYAHLSDFSPAIWEKLKERQVAEELNNADVFFKPEEIPVKQGEMIAKSGNSGSSGGPHVHFEVRGLMSAPGADDEEWYDPITYFQDSIKDTTTPRIFNIFIYKYPNTPYTFSTQILNRIATAWGKVGFGIKANDYMDKQGNTFGVKRVRLFCDNKLIYSWSNDFFRYDETRYINSLIDYKLYSSKWITVMKTYVEPNNKLRTIDHSLGDGIVDINEERNYKMHYEVEDAHGNVKSINFTIKGVKQQPRTHKPKGFLVKADQDFKIDTLGFSFSIPKGNLYCDADLEFSVINSNNGKNLSKIYNFGTKTVPLHDFCELRITLPDTLTNGDKLYVADIEGGIYKAEYLAPYTTPLGSTVLSPVLKTKVRTFGSFVVRKDNTPPSIVTVGKQSSNYIRLRIGDTESGVSGWKVYIDGKFVPCDKDNHGRIIGYPTKYGIEKGKHEVEVHAYDLLMNEKIHRFKIYN